MLHLLLALPFFEINDKKKSAFDKVTFQTLSTHMAMPIPPPMHSDTTPFTPPVLWRECSIVTSTLQPDMPMGWPREMAPPFTFTWAMDQKAALAFLTWRISDNLLWSLTLSAFSPSSLTTAMDWAANASLISNKSTWSSCQPAFSACQNNTKEQAQPKEKFQTWRKKFCSTIIHFSPLSWWLQWVQFPWWMAQDQLGPKIQFLPLVWCHVSVPLTGSSRLLQLLHHLHLHAISHFSSKHRRDIYIAHRS